MKSERNSAQISIGNRNVQINNDFFMQQFESILHEICKSKDIDVVRAQIGAQLLGIQKDLGKIEVKTLLVLFFAVVMAAGWNDLYSWTPLISKFVDGVVGFLLTMLCLWYAVSLREKYFVFHLQDAVCRDILSELCRMKILKALQE